VPGGVGEWIERNGLVGHRLRLLFVPTPKVGCSSVMRAMAAAEGTLRPASEFISSRGEQSRELTIHDPLVHGLPTVGSLRSEERERILNDSSWVRFCVTRDPYRRVVSGWINRVLLNSADALGPDLAFARHHFDGGLPRDMGVAFRAFVHELLSDPDRVVADDHFVAQVDLIRPDDFPYTDIVPLTDLDTFVDRVAHSSSARAGFEPMRLNASMHVDPSSLIDAETAGLIERFYAEDFRRLGYPMLEFPTAAGASPFSDRELELISIVRQKSDRIVDFQLLHAPRPGPREFIRRARRALSRRLGRR